MGFEKNKVLVSTKDPANYLLSLFLDLACMKINKQELFYGFKMQDCWGAASCWYVVDAWSKGA